MSHACDAHQCPAEIARGKFMCTRHWFMVPITVRRTINDRYRARRADFAYLSDVAYLEACIAAIEAVGHAEGHSSVPDTSYHRLLRVAKKRQQPASASREANNTTQEVAR